MYIELVDISLNLKSQLSFSQYFILIVWYFPVTMMISEIVLLITWSSWRMAPYKQQPLAIQSSSKEGLTQSRINSDLFHTWNHERRYNYNFFIYPYFYTRSFPKWSACEGRIDSIYQQLLQSLNTVGLWIQIQHLLFYGDRVIWWSWWWKN